MLLIISVALVFYGVFIYTRGGDPLDFSGKNWSFFLDCLGTAVMTTISVVFSPAFARAVDRLVGQVGSSIRNYNSGETLDNNMRSATPAGSEGR